ncbi:hypothetical protein ACFVIM_03510 [Streptomyces sp. NPDC057638]|uniref:hypothetical protein n=1 Tax=Streptomyces sp. NPDC057638 TaxID=3346190 RepID=UPI0036BBA6F3
MATGLAAVAGAAAARPATAATNYLILTVEQGANQIQRFSNGTADWNGTPGWYWTAPSNANTSPWYRLSDVKRRLTTRWGAVLVSTSSGTSELGGCVAMIRESDKSVVWSAVVPGNPHAIERIERHGVIVTASSRARVFGRTAGDWQNGGGLTVFVPPTPGGLPSMSFADSFGVDFRGARGVWWDDANELLVATGEGELRAYRLVTDAAGSVTGLALETSLGLVGAGHDVQPDYSSDTIFYTVGGDATNPGRGIWETRLQRDTATGAWGFAPPVRIHDWLFTKSFGRLPDGTSFWQDAPTANEWWSDTIGFSGRADSVRTGARFYKARFWSHALT